MIINLKLPFSSLLLCISILISFIVPVTLSACEIQNCRDATLKHGLYSDIYYHLDSKDENDRYLASIIIAELPLPNEAVATLSKKEASEADPFCKLLFAYILAKRTQETKFVDDFISLYPAGAEQSQIWTMQEKSYFLGLESPLQEFLTALATENDKAFLKLVSGLRYSDGVHGEILLSALNQLYKQNAKRAEALMVNEPKQLKAIKEY